MALLKEKTYEDISVQDIIARADVARSTFYVHYVDKNDLLVGHQGIFAGNLDQHADSIAHDEEGNNSFLPTRLWFHHIQAQGHIMKVIAKDPAMNLAMKTLDGIVHRDIQVRIERHLTTDKNASIPATVIIDYLTASLMTLIKWWIKHDMSYSPQKMDEMFQQLVMPGVSSVIKD